MTTPRLGAPELTEGQAAPETTVNEQGRYYEQGASSFIVKDKDLATPPASPADGDAYIVAATATGAWVGKEKRIAFYASGWLFITPIKGMRAYVQDESAAYDYSGSAWAPASGGSSTAEWAPNFTAAGDVYIPVAEAMTIGEGNAKIGTGTVAYAKSTAAAPGTFSSTTLPASLEAGAWLRVTASAVTGGVAVHLKRTA